MAGHAPDRLDVGAASRGAARRGADAVGRLEASASEIRLGPLDETAVAQVARDMLGGEPDEALRQVLSRADGQPFLLTELLRGLRAENLMTVDGGTAKLATGATVAPARGIGGWPARAADRTSQGRGGDGLGARAQLLPG